MADILKSVRNEIFKEFGKMVSQDSDKARKKIHEATFLGDEDPGGWAPNSKVVIHTETGIPNSTHEYGGGYPITEAWIRISDALPSGHYCENVNAAVVAVYCLN